LIGRRCSYVRSFERVPTYTVGEAVDRKIEWLKKTDPGADNPETRLRIQREKCGQGLINHWGIQLGLWSEPLPLVHNFSGTLIGMSHIMLPYLILPLYGSMRAIDEAYVKAAANLRASPVRAFWSVYLPLSLPGLAAGATIVFILCLGFYVMPALPGAGRSAVFAPASCSFSIPIIYSSANRDGRIVRLHDRRTLAKSGGSSGSQVNPRGPSAGLDRLLEAVRDIE
jgi:hypothetical protein